MDWEKYTRKKNAGQSLGSPIIGTVGGMRVKGITPVDFKSGDVVGPIPKPLPTFDEVWETIATEIDTTIPSYTTMTGETIMQCMRLAMRIMYEALTQEQNDE